MKFYLNSNATPPFIGDVSVSFQFDGQYGYRGKDKMEARFTVIFKEVSHEKTLGMIQNRMDQVVKSVFGQSSLFELKHDYSGAKLYEGTVGGDINQVTQVLIQFGVSQRNITIARDFYYMDDKVSPWNDEHNDASGPVGWDREDTQIDGDSNFVGFSQTLVTGAMDISSNL